MVDTASPAQGGNYAWTARLDAPRFDPKPLLGESSLTGLSVALTGSGDRRSGTLNGELGLNDYQLHVQPLTARFSDDLNTLTIEQLGIASPQFTGGVGVHGVVQLAAKPLAADVTVEWKDVVLPEQMAGQTLLSHGSLTAKGSPNQFHAESTLAIGPAGKLADVTLDLDGTQKLINLHALTIKQPQGDLQAKGTLDLQPALGWQLEAVERGGFDPEAFEKNRAIEDRRNEDRFHFINRPLLRAAALTSIWSARRKDSLNARWAIPWCR